MNLIQYRRITSARYDNATAGGTDNTTDTIKVDPNKYLVIPINKTAETFLIILLIILTTLMLVKQIKSL